MALSRVISISVILSLLFILIISHHTTAQPTYSYNFCVYEKGNYTANSAYHRNLNTLLSNLSSNTEIDYGFYNFSQGQGSDRVNAIAMCRGDVKPENCRNCLNVARVKLTELCPNQKEAIVWYDLCMLRYSNRTIFHTKETSQEFYMWNVNNATNADQFNQVLSNLMEKLRTTAKAGDSRRKYAADSAKGPSFQNIYGLVQCTPDLSSLECDQCLADSILQIPQCCNNKIGGRVIGPSCNIRFESGPFFETTADTLPSPPPSPSPTPSTSPSTNNNTSSSQGKSKSNTSRIAVAVAVPVVVVVLVLCFICVYLRVRKRRREITETKEGVDESEEIIANESFQFDFDTIRVATSDFSDSNKLGQGGFGAVYKGKLSNGQMIAVKRLSCNSSQGAMEFKNEVLLLAKLQHRNLVRLLGFCLEGSERLLVYEYVPNKSLDYFIFDQIKKGQLNWMMRYKIIEGVARALLYLHEDSRLRIIHRDLKASNILLDEGMNPKISDFGLAKLFVMDQTQGNTSRIAGTYGYMAPEYAMFGNFSVKSDVFSFGVLVLEIVSGQKHIGIRNGENAEDLLSFSWKNWKEGTATKIIDPSLNNYSLNEMIRCIHIGLLCVQENVTDRPNMTSIVLMLNSYSLTLPVPSEPAFFRDSRAVGLLLPDIQSGDYNSRETRASESTSKSAQVSENEASITELYPR